MHDRRTTIALIQAALLLAALLLSGCESTPQQSMSQQPTDNGAAAPSAQPSGPPIGEVRMNARVGAGKLNLEQVQADVEAFADRAVLSVAQATDQVARENPEFRGALHAVKLAVGSGAYSIASGPNPLVNVLDLVVQGTLVRNSIESNLAQRLPSESAERLVNVFRKVEQDAWALGERVLSQQELADLRVLIDTWVEDNPNQIYVAGIRFADFSRLRPREGRSLPSSIFGLLRIDPFASINPASREIEEARELAERAFYYLQRMPQLIRWQSEGFYYELATANETQQVLQNLQTVANLPQTLPETLRESEESIGNLLKETNATIAATQETLNDLTSTSGDLKQLSEAVTETGKVWQDTAKAFTEVANAFNPPDDPDAPPSEPVSLHDYITMLKEAQTTAGELRLLLNDLNSTVASGAIERSVAASAAETRREAQGLIYLITICAAALIALMVIGAIVYRAYSHRMTMRAASIGAAHLDNE